jgi:hypothetical protein
MSLQAPSHIDKAQQSGETLYSKEYYEEIVGAFEAFLFAIDKLCLHIIDDLKDYPIWVDNGHGEFVNDRDKVVYVLKHISPKLDLNPQETYSCPGAVGATYKTFELIQEVNIAKDNFRSNVQEYKDLFKPNPTRPARQIIAAAGYGGVKLLQVYRHIHFIDFHPRRIAWTKSKKSSNVIINKAQAEKLIYKIGKGEHIDIQLAKLSLLKPDQQLVVYRPLRSFWGVNTSTFKDNDNYSTFHRIREISLPLFYLHESGLPTPLVCFSSKSSRKVNVRMDKLAEDEPFLKSIHAYRYKNT